MCFAIYNNLPALRATVHYYNQDRVGVDTTFSLQNCPEWPMTYDRSWQHMCINLHSCLSDYYQDGQMFQVQRLQFDRQANWAWVDEVAIAAGAIGGLMCEICVQT